MFDPNKLTEIFGNLQEKAKELQEQSKNTIYTAKSGGGLVSVSVNGNAEVVDLNIDDSLLEDKESLQILLMSAINDAYSNAENARRESTLGALGDLNLFGKN